MSSERDVEQNTIARSYKYRLYPTAAQIAILESWQSACLDIQRVCIIQRRAAWERYRISNIGLLPSWASQGREVTELRAIYPHLAVVPADTMSAIVKRVDEAYRKMRKDRKAGKEAKVRWAKSPSEIGLLFRGQERGTRLAHQGIKFGWWRLAASGKLGALKVRMHRAIPEGAVIKQAHITKRIDGWFISFSCTIPAPEPLAPTSKPVNGVDLGCIHEGDQQRVAVVDDGRIYTVTSELKRNQKRLAHMQRMVDPRRKVKENAKAADPNSKRTQKRREGIAKKHAQIARQREHTQQYIAKRLVESANTTAFEDVNWQALRRQGAPREAGDNRQGGRKAKKGLNRAMSTASPGRLIALTEEKAQVAGREVVKVNARNTSQACSSCGTIGEKKSLSVREWTCGECGAAHDRDINAARNIAARHR